MIAPSSLRFFRAVIRPGTEQTAVAALVAAFGTFLARTDPNAFDQVIALALLFQAFAASTGYRERLTRGHFDPILVGREDRLSVAFSHWVVSAAPGLLLWIILAAIDLAARPGHWSTALTLPALTAFLYVTTMAWTITLLLVRYAGGVVWLLGIFGLATMHDLHVLREDFLAGHQNWPAAFHAARAAMLCPMFLVGDAQQTDVRIIVLMLAITVIAWTVAWSVIGLLEARLLERC